MSRGRGRRGMRGRTHDAPRGGAPQAAAAAQRGGQWGGGRGVLDVHHCLWAGDLNYRLAGVGDGEARALLRAGHLARLAEFDELSAMRRAGGGPAYPPPAACAGGAVPRRLLWLRVESSPPAQCWCRSKACLANCQPASLSAGLSAATDDAAVVYPERQVCNGRETLPRAVNERHS